MKYTPTKAAKVSYQISGQHVVADEHGIRWDEREFGITWPLPVTVICEQGASRPSGKSRLAPAEKVASCISR